MEVENWVLYHWGIDNWVLYHWRCGWDFRISTDRGLKHRKMRRAFVASDSMVSIVRIVSLSSCRRTKVKKLINRSYFWKCLWCNGYRHRKWIRRHKFKSWTRLIAFHIALIPLGKAWIQVFSFRLWVNSWADWFFSLGKATSLGEGKLWI